MTSQPSSLGKCPVCGHDRHEPNACQSMRLVSSHPGSMGVDRSERCPCDADVERAAREGKDKWDW